MDDAAAIHDENPFGETIYSYSRAQAIEDGVLVDLSAVEIIRQAWKTEGAEVTVVLGSDRSRLHLED